MYKIKYILLILVLVNILFAKDIKNLKASKSFKASASVIDLVYKKPYLYAATSSSAVDIFDLRTQKLIKTIKLPKVKDFVGDIIDSKVYSIDILKDKILITSQGKKGFRRIYIHENNTLSLIISEKSKMFIAKAKFINEDLIIFSLLSNQMFLYDIKNKKTLWEIQVSHSKFSDFALNEEKNTLILADESGDLKQIDVKTGKIQKRYEGKNLDNVFQIDFKNSFIATAGQDRRCVVYDKNKNSSYYKMASFLIYSVALSPQGNLVAYANDEDNNISVFKRSTKQNLYTLRGTKTTLNKIIFISENELFTASDDEIINYWKLKEIK